MKKTRPSSVTAYVHGSGKFVISTSKLFMWFWMNVIFLFKYSSLVAVEFGANVATGLTGVFVGLELSPFAKKNKNLIF